MTREPWPNDRAYAAALLATVVRDIEQRDDEDRQTLLAGFLCTAWPTSRGQDQ